VAGTSADRYPVSAAATFVASGSTLTLTLVNTSPASKTIHPSQVLTSFYFDMLGVGAERVGLTCTSGSGVVVKVGAEGTEGEPAASVWTSTTDKEPPSGPDASAPLMLTLGDILVAGGVDGGWMFLTGFDVARDPFCFYGLGTAGDDGQGGFAPNAFPAKHVGDIDLGIVPGGVSDGEGMLGAGPDGTRRFVSGTATFTFQADRDIGKHAFVDPVVFGFGTSPDQVVRVTPEPVTPVAVGVAAALGCAAMRGRRRRQSGGGP